MAFFKKRNKEEQVNQEQVKQGGFVGSVLLSKPIWNKQEFKQNLREQWGIIADEEDGDKNEDILVFKVGDLIATICLMQSPVPNHEAEENALNNFMWTQAVEQTKQHQAHLLVAVLGDGILIERAKLFVKLISTTCSNQNTIGIFTSGTVFEPSFYYDFSQMMKEDMFPIFNLIWFGLYKCEDGVSGYTYGMDVFGKDEMEMLDTALQPSELRDILSDLALYVIEQDVELHDGETIGFSENQIWPITKSEGVSLPVPTLKITYR